MHRTLGNAHDIRVQRRELKYYIPYKEYLVLSNILGKFMKRDAYSKKPGGYFIRSLYFDTLDNKSFEEKMAGLEERAKYRLRIYSLNDKWAKFEIKAKLNNSIIKETAVIKREDAIRIQNGDYEVMPKYNDSVLNKAYREFRKSHYVPAVLIDYVRDAFVYDANGIRIVFDKFLKSTSLQLDIFSRKAFPTQKLKKDTVIMEIKYHGFVPDFIKQLMQPQSFGISAISKYCIGRIDNFDM